jgi:hypothetical protein
VFSGFNFTNNWGAISFGSDNGGTTLKHDLIISNGKVGIGTTSPAYTLDVHGGSHIIGGDVSTTGEIALVRDDLDTVHSAIHQAGSNMHFRLSRGTNPLHAGKDFLIVPYNYGMAVEYNGVLEFYNQDFSVHKWVNGNQGAYFWVGDETDSGGLFVTAHDSGNSATSYVLLSADKFDPARLSQGYGSMLFQVRNVTDAFRFQSGPWQQAVTKAQIGTETSATNFDVLSGSVQGRLRADASTGAVQLGSSSSNRLDFFTAGGAPQMTLLPNGNVGIGATSPGNILTVAQGSATDPIADAWTTYSSRRWKTHIQPIEGALEKVERLRGVYFDWKGSGKHDLGLIAEEVGKVVPEVVAYEKNGQDAKSVDYARLTALLVEALKQQQAEIQELKSQMQRFDAQLREGTQADLIPKPQASVQSSFPAQSCSR